MRSPSSSALFSLYCCFGLDQTPKKHDLPLPVWGRGAGPGLWVTLRGSVSRAGAGAGGAAGKFPPASPAGASLPSAGQSGALHHPAVPRSGCRRRPRAPARPGEGRTRCPGGGITTRGCSATGMASSPPALSQVAFCWLA